MASPEITLQDWSDCPRHYARAADAVLPMLKVNISEAFRVEGRDRSPCPTWLPKRRSGVTPNRGSTNGAALLLPTRAYALDERLPSPTVWPQGVCRPLP